MKSIFISFNFTLSRIKIQLKCYNPSVCDCNFSAPTDSITFIFGQALEYVVGLCPAKNWDRGLFTDRVKK